jgi:hypothetical protein
MEAAERELGFNVAAVGGSAQFGNIGVLSRHACPAMLFLVPKLSSTAFMLKDRAGRRLLPALTWPFPSLSRQRADDTLDQIVGF